MKFAIDTGHRGRLSKPNDPGAVRGALVEADLVAHYALAAEVDLYAKGHTVFPLRDGEYSERAARAKGYDVDAVVACHVNAFDGPADYGRVLYYPGSIAGQRLAEHIARAIGGVTPWPVLAEAAAPSRWPDAHAIVRRYSAPAVCLEPGFISGPAGLVWFSDPLNLERLGRAIAAGLTVWRP